MQVYVAGKTHDLAIVQEVQAWLIREGHSVTHDWTVAVEKHGADHEGEPLSREDAEHYAIEDIHGVRVADVVVAVPSSRWCGTLLEIGAALITNTPVVILGIPYQRCVFWAHPRVRMTTVEWPHAQHELAGTLAQANANIGPPPSQRVPTSGRQ